MEIKHYDDHDNHNNKKLRAVLVILYLNNNLNISSFTTEGVMCHFMNRARISSECHCDFSWTHRGCVCVHV